MSKGSLCIQLIFFFFFFCMAWSIVLIYLNIFLLSSLHFFIASIQFAGGRMPNQVDWAWSCYGRGWWLYLPGMWYDLESSFEGRVVIIVLHITCNILTPPSFYWQKEQVRFPMDESTSIHLLKALAYWTGAISLIAFSLSFGKNKIG